MGLDQYAYLRNQKINFKNVFSDKYEPTKDGFYWRKHARLQTFMQKEYESIHGDEADFNGDAELEMTPDIIKRLRENIASNYHENFCQGGFFWGHQFQEEQMKEYRDQDLQFCDWVLAQIEKGNKVIYSCSW